jgi:putative ABC transport system permease protein
MNLLYIAWRNLCFRALAGSLTIVSMALGVALTVLVLSISGIIQETLQRHSNVGYNLVIGCKGNSTQLVFNSVYYLSKPIENLKYSYYLEFLPGDERQSMFKKLGGDLNEPDRPGLYSAYTRNSFAIPICLGDYVGRFRAVGTTPDFFNRLRHGDANDKPYTFAVGRNFVEESPEHGFFEAVVGAQVARELQLKVGDTINASHGEGADLHHEDFTIVGILDYTGTPNDRAAFLNLEGFYLLEGHTAPERDEESGLELKKKVQSEPSPHEKTDADSPSESHTDVTQKTKRLSIEKREVTAILFWTQSLFSDNLRRQINKTPHAQAVSPIGEISGLLKYFIDPLQAALLILTLCVCVVSAIGILVSIYNSMHQRTRDIAVMRALGASRDTVLLVILIESCLIAVAGGIIGWFVGHGVGFLMSPWIEARTGVRISLWSLHPNELWIIPGLIVIGSLAGLIPSLVAYRTDVSKSLGS